MYYVPLLYGFLSVSVLIMVPKKGQYQPKSGSVSNDRHPKSGTSIISNQYVNFPRHQ